MGVPALFRWLSRKYPKIVTEVREEDPPRDGVRIDYTRPNPNGQEFDNLYLDYNGIVHNCTHPEGRPPPATEEEMMVEIFKETDRIVNMVRPRKLLMIAIDGVAPRAKMNQQRGRRFRTAMDAATKEEEKQAAILEWQSMGRDVSEQMQNKEAWDSNAITPGTPFMDLLAASTRYWVASKINEDPAWRNLNVIISDASVPGEGEHKIMDLIRRQRTQAGYDPNTTHVINGLDADLIMLSLATHEPHFKVLREDVFAQERNRRGGGCHRCGQPGHHSSTCTAPPKDRNLDFDGKTKHPDRKPFIFLDVAILREYLEVELNVPNVPFPFDLERAIDDWVFMIFFVGNDFLPHLPSLDIREGAIDVLLEIWRKGLPTMGGYLTEHGHVNLERAQVMLDGLAIREDDIFRRRREAEERQNHGEKRRRVERQRSTPQLGDMNDGSSQEYVQVRSLSSSAPAQTDFLAKPPATAHTPTPQLDRTQIAADNLSAAQRLKAELLGAAMTPAAEETKIGAAIDTITKSDVLSSEAPRGTKRTADEAGMPQGRPDADEEGASTVEQVPVGPSDQADPAEVVAQDVGGSATVADASDVMPFPGMKPPPLTVMGNVAEQEDIVKLWEPGYKERYYRQKFGIELSDLEFRRSIVQSYLEGLCWVLAYYYQGCPSWQWFYPHHFAPFASDFTDLASMEIKFDQGGPVQPFEQLMSVFPAASRKHIPEVFHELMTEPTSEIIDFYPERFHIDMNGKKMIWQGVALLPFIERSRLIAAIEPRYPQLTPFEVQRNTIHESPVLFFSEENALYDVAIPLYTGKGEEPALLDVKRSRGLAGAVLKNEDCIPNSTFQSPLHDVGLDDITNDRSLSVVFRYPELKVPHRSVLLKGYQRSKRVLSDRDLERTMRGGAPDYERSHNDGFHASRRDIDGVGVSRARDRWERESPRRDRPQSYPSPRTNYHGAPPYNGYGDRLYDPYSGYHNGYNNGNYRPQQDYYDNRGPPYQQTSYGSPYGSQQGAYGQNPYGTPNGGYMPPPRYDGPREMYGGQPQNYSQYAPPEQVQPPLQGTMAPPPPARPTIDNRDAYARAIPPHLLAAAGQRPSYRR